MDEELFRAINQGLASPSMDWIMVKVTSPESWLAPGLVMLASMAAIGKKRGVAAILAAIFSVGVGDAMAHQVFKPLVGRPRPCAELKNVHQPYGVGCTGSFSFPSNHAVNSFAVASSIGVVYPKLLIVLGPIAAMVGLSRITVGVHYPSDVLAGALFGILIGVGAGSLALRIFFPEAGRMDKNDE